MIENKRFTFIHFDWLQWHIYDNESLLCEVTDDEDAENLCKLLNELNDENVQLKKQIAQLHRWNKCLAEKRHQELQDNCIDRTKRELDD